MRLIIVNNQADACDLIQQLDCRTRACRVVRASRALQRRVEYLWPARLRENLFNRAMYLWWRIPGRTSSFNQLWPFAVRIVGSRQHNQSLEIYCRSARNSSIFRRSRWIGLVHGVLGVLYLLHHVRQAPLCYIHAIIPRDCLENETTKNHRCKLSCMIAFACVVHKKLISISHSACMLIVKLAEM